MTESTVPQVVRSRTKGQKGPGKIVTIVKTLNDANKVKADLTTPETEIFFSDFEVPTIVGYDTWKANREEADAKEAARKAAIAKLSDEDRAALGL